MLDSGAGQRLERFGKFVLARPDPQAIWQTSHEKLWSKADAVFTETGSKRPGWTIKTNVPERWRMNYGPISFWAKLSPFKHTGVFPEQISQWQFMEEQIKSSKKQLNILNLFAYTGIASLVCARAGARVTHVDASRPTIGWARDNQALSKLADKPIRWILDDVLKFVKREVKRGVKYDGLIMDPPVYGHGPNGEKWDFGTSFPQLVAACRQILSDHPAFIVINAYAVSASSLMLRNVLEDLTSGGEIECGELVLQEKNSDRLLSTGIFGRWRSK